MSELANRLAKVADLEKELVNRCAPLMQAGTSIHLADFFVLGATKRAVALSAGFRGLLEAKNFTCAASLLRMQIDTAARVYALRQIADLHDFGSRMLAGERFDRQKTADGHKLKDFYIIEELAKDFPWVRDVYKETSDFVHLSGRHFFASVSRTDDDEMTVHIEVGATDPQRPEADYFEVVEAFFEATKLTGTVVLGYLHAKQTAAEKTPPNVSVMDLAMQKLMPKGK